MRHIGGKPSADWTEAIAAVAATFGLDPDKTVRVSIDSLGLVVTSVSEIPSGVATDTRYVPANTFTHPAKAVPVEGN